jgi:hypothetical protein
MALEFEQFIQSETWEIDPGNLQVGPSQKNTDQIVATLTDRWTARIVLLAGLPSLSAFRAWKTSRRGRLIVDQMGPKRELAGSADGRTFGATVLHDDGTPHDDGTGYAQGYVATTGAAAGATRLAITALGVTDQFAIGRFFGIGGRLYQITAPGGTSSTEALVDFWPPLHAVVAAGESFDWLPRTSMRLAADDAAPINDRVGERFDVTIDLVEVP